MVLLSGEASQAKHGVFRIQKKLDFEKFTIPNILLQILSTSWITSKHKTNQHSTSMIFNQYQEVHQIK
jgi:hypothetical protein